MEEKRDVFRDWLVSLVVKALRACSSEQDRLDVLAWLALVREIIGDPKAEFVEKVKRIYAIYDSQKTVGIIFRGVSEAVRNYRDADLSLPLKIAIPVTLAAAAVIGGKSAGLAAFGGAIGAPILLICFIGVAGITAIIEQFISKPESADYISFVLAFIARDEILRRANKAMQDAMTSEPTAPKFAEVPLAELDLREALQSMDPFEFEKHVMMFFEKAGYVSWVTRKSNDMGVDGFARHPKGLIVVQCKRNAATSTVGRPIIQQFKGVIEENDAYRGYFVTTSTFTGEAIECAKKNTKVCLIDIDLLVRWHLQGAEV